MLTANNEVYMIYKTILDNVSIGSLNQAHQIVHKVMHDSDEHKPCPPFIIKGDTIIIQSAEKPKMAGVATCALDLAGLTSVRLAVRLAAVKRKSGTMLPVLADSKVDEAAMVAYVTKRFGEYGLSSVDAPTCSYRGQGVDETHGIKKFPICEVVGEWFVEDTSKLEQLLLRRVGRMKFLGLGMVRMLVKC